ncbi:MAG: hypothetical protein JEZ06_11055 [Anaerolineaceae bacterium]|nr:hypothetical protein [Anaerolineaceae bacterium]
MKSIRKLFFYLLPFTVFGLVLVISFGVDTVFASTGLVNSHGLEIIPFIDIYPGPSIEADPNEDWVDGMGWEDGVTVTVDIDGGEDGTYSDSGIPILNEIHFDLQGVYDLEPGHVVTFTQGTTIKTLEISSLFVAAVYSEANTVSGTAEPGAEVLVSIYECCYDDLSTTANPDGSWLVDSDDIGFDIHGEPWPIGFAKEYDADGDATRVDWVVPNSMIRAHPNDSGEDWIDAKEWNFGDMVSLTIDDDEDPGNGTLYTDNGVVGPAEWNASVGIFEFFLGEFDLLPGHIVTLAGSEMTRILTITNITVTDIDYYDATVTGTATPGTAVQAGLHEVRDCDQEIFADGNGIWTADFNLCEFTPDIGGWAGQEDADHDITVYFWPWHGYLIEGNPVDDWVAGRDWEEGEAVTLDINSSYFETQTPGPAPWDPDQIYLRFDLQGVYDLIPGDIVTLTQGTKSKTLIISNLLMTGFDEEENNLSGTANGENIVYTETNEWCCGYQLFAPVNPDGSWTLDFDDVGFDLIPGTGGSVWTSDIDGDVTRLDWRVRVPRFSVMWENQIWYDDWIYDTTITLTIDDPSTPQSPDFQTEHYVSDPDGNGQSDEFIFDFPTSPGFVFTLSDGESTKTHILRKLNSVWADPITDIVYGFSEVGELVIVSTPMAMPEHSVIVTNGDGSWEIDCSDYGIPFDVFGWVYIRDDDGNSTIHGWGSFYPYLEIIPENQQINLYNFPEFSLVDITIKDESSLTVFNGSINMGAETWILQGLQTEASIHYGEIDVMEGYTIIATDGITEKNHIVTLVLDSLNTETNIISGKAAPYSEVLLNVYGVGSRQEFVDEFGDWSADFSNYGDQNWEEPIDLMKGNDGDIIQKDNDLDQTRINWHISQPVIEADPIHDRIFGYDFLFGAEVSISIDDPNNGTGEDYSDTQTVGYAPWNPDQTWVEFQFGESFDLQPGHIITLSDGVSSKTHTVTSLSITTMDDTANTLSGTAEPGSEVRVWLHEVEGINISVIVDGTGSWTASFEGIYDLVAGTGGAAIQKDADGDYTYVDWYLPNPNIEADPIQDRIFGYDFLFGAEVSISIDDPINGIGEDYSDTQTVGYAPWDPEQTWVEFQFGDTFDLQPGHVVSLTDGVTSKIHTITNMTVTAVDEIANTVSGTAEAGTEVQLWLHEVCCLDISAVADGSGNWTASFNGVYDLVAGTGGAAVQFDEDGDYTYEDWYLPNPVIEADPFDNRVFGFDFLFGAEVSISIDDPSNGTGEDYSDTQTAEYTPWNPEQTWVNFQFGDSFDLQSGQIITLSDGVSSKTHTVTSLSITTMDDTANTLSGTAYPDSEVRLWIHEEEGSEISVITDGSGNWTASFEGIYDLVLGTGGAAIQEDEDGDYTNANWWIPNPSIEAAPFDDRVFGYGFPYGIDVTLSIDDPSNGPGIDYSDIETVGYAPWDPEEPWVDFQFGGSFDLQPGHIVTLTDGDIIKTHTITNLTVSTADAISDAVSGTADPGSEVMIWLHEVEGIDVSVIADGSGSWTASLSGVYDLVAGTGGAAVQFDADDDYTYVNWNAVGYCSNGNDIAGTVYAEDGSTPLEGAVVHFIEISNPGEDVCIVPTGSDGTYSVTLPDGIYELFADGMSYSRKYFQDTIDENAAHLTVSDIDQHSSIDFVLDLPFYIYEHFIFNLNDPVVGDLAVRQAIAYGSDRQRMLLETYPRSQVWDSYLPADHWAYNPDTHTYPYNPTTAAQILDDAGWLINGSGFREKLGQRLSFEYVGPLNPQQESIRNIFIENMTSIGIEVIDRTGDSPWDLIFNQRDFGVAEFFTFGVDLNDDWNIGFYFQADIFLNAAGYNDPAADQLLADANIQETRAGKLPYYKQHQVLVMDSLAELPLFHRCMAPDIDCDSFLDLLDNAPSIYNPDQSDIDGDGTGDVADICPSDDSDTCDIDNSTAESINNEGGILTTESVEIVIPTDALEEDTSMSITDIGAGFGLTTDLGEATAVYGVEIGPPGTVFEVPISITFSWEDVDDDGVVDGTIQPEADLFISKDGTAITDKCSLNSDCDMDANKLTFTVDSLSVFALATLDNIPPELLSISAPLDPISIEMTVEVSALFIDPDHIDTHTAVWDWGDSSTSDGTINGDSENGYNVTGSHNYTLPGVYTLNLMVNDAAGKTTTAEYQYIVIFDPEGGFVTGGGWIESPLNAYAEDPMMTGRANFGFVSKYQKGANIPSGQTEFHFKVADFKFQSSSYDWLVIAGSKSQFKGVGMINGEGTYKFILTAIDADLNEEDSFLIDRFRIKIWNIETEEIIYDNQMGEEDDSDSSTEISGGSIVIHKN